MNVVLSRVPTQPRAQAFSLDVGRTSYRFRLIYSDVPEGGWVLDIGDEEGGAIICGIPLVTGINLLGQHGYLGLGFGLYVANADGRDDAPTSDNLGTTSNLYLVEIQ